MSGRCEHGGALHDSHPRRSLLKATLALGAGLAACFGAACAVHPASLAAPPRAADIAALRWLAQGHDPVGFLTSRPVECLRPTADPIKARAQALGRAAFESPALLGGAAARRGVTCAACHVSGRDNPHFFIVGLSDAPGTADVTSSLFSKSRDDGTFNPRAIPDLAARDGHQIKDRTGPDFRAKAHGLIVDEFDGQEPPPEVFEDVLAYLDGLDIKACQDPTARAARSPEEDLQAVAAALAGARAARAPEAAGFWIRVARFRLERLEERYLGVELEPVRRRLETLSATLAGEGEARRAGRAPVETVSADALEDLARAVRRGQDKSLFNADRLRAALASP